MSGKNENIACPECGETEYTRLVKLDNDIIEVTLIDETHEIERIFCSKCNATFTQKKHEK